MIILEEHIVPSGVEVMRISDYAYRYFKLLNTRKGMKKALDRGEVQVNGETIGTGHLIREGQIIALIDNGKNTPKEYHLKIDVIFEDEYLAVVKKPAGIVVSGNQFRTVENTLSYNLKQSKQEDTMKWPKPVHRLDHQTSGLLLIAKTKFALVALGKQFHMHTIKKKYATVVIGKCPEKGEVITYIGNQKAISKFERIKVTNSPHNEFLSLVEIEPITGRTHQIRLHMKSIGHPILGDKLYGEEGNILKHKGLFLASIELGFIHPILQKEVCFKTDHPKKFDRIMRYENNKYDSAL